MLVLFSFPKVLFNPIYVFECSHSHLCLDMSNKTSGCTESLLLNRNSGGGSGEHLPSSPTYKCSEAEINNATLLLFWVGLLPSKNDLPIRKYNSYKITKGKYFLNFCRLNDSFKGSLFNV